VVEVVRFLAVLAGMLALLTLPCWLILIVSADVVVDYLRRTYAIRIAGRRRCRLGRSWRERRSFASLDRDITRATASEPDEPCVPPIERIAADLRRLGRQRIDIGNRSPVWHLAVQRAYDDRLRIACRALNVTHHLNDLSGVDLDIERLRVEGELQSTGLAMSISDAGWRQDQR
jgi:hypothetical protein